MANLIVAFPRIDDAKNIKNVLVRNGYTVAAACSTGAQAINYAEDLMNGIIVCGYRFPDMLAFQLKEQLPAGFDMLMIASSEYHDPRRSDIVFVSMPLKVHDLISSLEMVSQNQDRRRRKMREAAKTRTDQERGVIEEAKRVLMDRNHMTEAQAHRYIQKCSMDSGINMVETAQMIISILFEDN